MKDLKNLIKEILEKGYLISLATYDGSVWVSDLIYITDGFDIYWLSNINRRHSKSIESNKNVAGTITISNNKGEKNIGLQIEGVAKKIEGDILEIAIKHRLKRGKPAPKKIGEVLEANESWYVLKPKKIEIIHEPLFGLNKKSIKF